MGIYEQNYLMHHGEKGQKWGVRRAPWYPIAAYEKSVANGGTTKERPKGGLKSSTYKKMAEHKTAKKSALESENKNLNQKKNVYSANASQAKVNINNSKNNINHIKNKYAKRDMWDIGHRSKTAKKVAKEQANIDDNTSIMSKYEQLIDEVQAKIDSNNVDIDKYNNRIEKLMAKADKKEVKEHNAFTKKVDNYLRSERYGNDQKTITNIISKNKDVKNALSEYENTKAYNLYSDFKKSVLEKEPYDDYTPYQSYDFMEYAKSKGVNLKEINDEYTKAVNKLYDACKKATNDDVGDRTARVITDYDTEEIMSDIDYDLSKSSRQKGGKVTPRNYDKKVDKILNSSKSDEKKDRKLRELDAEYGRNYSYNQETGKIEKGYSGPKYSSIQEAKKKSLADKVVNDKNTTNDTIDGKTEDKKFNYSLKEDNTSHTEGAKNSPSSMKKLSDRELNKKQQAASDAMYEYYGRSNAGKVKKERIETNYGIFESKEEHNLYKKNARYIAEQMVRSGVYKDYQKALDYVLKSDDLVQ